MKPEQRQKNPPRKPKKQRRFAKVDVAYFREDEEEDGVNPDWLIGAY